VATSYPRLLVLVAGLVLAASVQAGTPAGLMTLDGRAAPELVLTGADLGKFDLQSQRGKWVLVHFWASWCGPCRKELPTIQRMAKQIDQNKLKVVMINTAETEDEVFIFLSSIAPDLESYLDRDGSITERWQPRGLPSSFFVDPQGKLRYLALGGRPWDQEAYLDFVRGLYAR